MVRKLVSGEADFYNRQDRTREMAGSPGVESKGYVIELLYWLVGCSQITGMFLYAKVVLSAIEYLDDFTEMENELKVLPESLNAAYDFPNHHTVTIIYLSNLNQIAMREYSRELTTYHPKVREKRLESC